MTDWKQDAQFVGAFVRGGDWEVGLRIARHVTADSVGGRPKKTGGNPPVNGGRVSLRDFAIEAGIDRDTVAKYLSAWEWAADAGVVDSSATLTDDSEYDWPASGLTQDDWREYYQIACASPPFWNPSGKAMEPRKGLNRHVAKDISDEAVVAAIKAKPELVSDAITSEDDKVATAARNAIAKRQNERIDAKAKERGVERNTISNKDWKDRWADIDEQFEGALEELGRKELIQEYLFCSEAITKYASAIEKLGVIGVAKEQTQIENANSQLSAAIWTTESVLKKNVEKR